jgi:type I restriction-modification system DNA methylase subunit
MNTAIIRQIFQSKFDYQTYCNEIVHNIFGCNDIAIRPELLDATADGDECNYIGRMTDADGRELGFFYTRVAAGSDVRRKRVGLRKMIAPYLKYDVDAAIAVFADENHWRLSYICDMKEGVTNAKRFSYVLGEEQGQYKTPLERLDNIYAKRGRYVLNDLRDAFSVDALSNEFFKDYHFHYDRIVDELARQGKSGATYHDYVKKMLGRIVFLHFLQKKGWLDGNLYFLRDMFFFSPHQADFLDQVLEPLFFGIFNTEQNKRVALFKERKWDTELLKQWQSLPYLNGGLFEEDAIDRMRISLPAKLFEDLFRYLASYNFTVDENDPDDAEIGVDPEMLGKIFESLLEDNKAKGAFYTPKEIVRYMCKESLIAYLSSKLPDVNDSIVRAFVESHEMQPELEPYRDTLDQALRDVKICDPAIGSGAFPMGLLNELWRCREALEPTGSRVALKKEIIENNIYGVDIERGAIDIARLRFWLSIVVDSEQPEALPNFDYKFMQGNSLIESCQGCDLSRIAGKTVGRPSTSTQLVIGLDSDLSRKNLQRLLREYFSVTDHQKKADMRQAINEEVKTLIRESLGGTISALAKLNALDPSANQEFFLWHTWFKDIFDGGGFDIVIGNPPYISTKERSEEEKEKLNSVFGFVDDLYHHFIICGFNLLKNDGIISMITSDTYFTTFTKRSLRKKFLDNSILQLIHWGHDVFDSALVSTATFICQKRNSRNGVIAFHDVKGKKTIEEGSEYLIPQNEYSKSINGCFYVPTELCLGLSTRLANIHNKIIIEWWDKIENSRKIANNAKKLDDYRKNLKEGDITIVGLVTDGGQGMATGNNGKFVGVKANTRQSFSVIESRPMKLSEVNRKYRLSYELPNSEVEIWQLFDSLKETYGNNIFGQGYIYRIVPDSLLAECDSLTNDEKEYGIIGSRTFVPYDKGDKDGNRWYLDNPFVIDWSRNSVHFLKSNSGKKGKGMPVVRNAQFYFMEGFCWNNNLNERYYNIKCKEKKAGIHDVASMSLFELTTKVPAYYLVTLINSSLCGYFYRMFLNNTVNVQVNDLRMLPVIVPSKEYLIDCKKLFDCAVETQKRFFNQQISSDERDGRLSVIQNDVDKLVFEIYGLKQSDYPPLGKTLY